MALFCTSCGAKLNDGIKFCTACGAAVPQPQAPAASPAAEPVTQPISEPVAQTAASPAAEPVVRPVAEPIVPPVTKPVEPTVAAPVVAPVVNRAAEPVAKPAPQYQPPAQPAYNPPPSYPAPSQVAGDLNSDGEPPKGSKYAPMRVSAYFWSILAMCLPIVGFIIAIIWACGGAKNVNRRNLAKCYWVFVLVSVVLTIVVTVLSLVFFREYFDRIISDLQSGDFGAMYSF